MRALVILPNNALPFKFPGLSSNAISKSLNFSLQFGGPLAVSVFLIVLSAAGEDHLPTVWRVCFGVGIALPVSVFFFRLKMLSSKLYKKGAIKRVWPSLKTPCFFLNSK